MAGTQGPTDSRRWTRALRAAAAGKLRIPPLAHLIAVTLTPADVHGGPRRHGRGLPA